MMNRKYRVLSVLLASLLMVATICSRPITVSAQSGAGVDTCTYYFANGFESYQQCANWSNWMVRNHTPAWKNKLDKCIVKLSITASIGIVTKALVNPYYAALTYGGQLINCMF